MLGDLLNTYTLLCGAYSYYLYKQMCMLRNVYEVTSRT